jgi:hypothetical protein
MKNIRVEYLVLVLMLLCFCFTEVNATSGGNINEDFQWAEYSGKTYLCDSSDETPEPVSKDFVMQGVTFRITANSDGDGSAVAWHKQYGKDNSACIGFMSGGEHDVYNSNTTERITIVRKDGEPWVLDSLWADEKDCENIIFTGILNGNTVVTKACDGRNQTLNFGNVVIDTLVISAKHFQIDYFNIDNLKGNTEAAINNKPTASSFIAILYENTAYAFSTSQFGYADDDGNSMDYLKIISVPANGSLWLDSDNNNSINGSETILTNGATITKTQLDAGNLKYINTNGYSSSFIYKVNDGEDDSELSYTTTLDVTPKPTVTLRLGSNSTIYENGGTATIKATLSNTYDKKTTVNLSFSGTANSTDYSAPSTIEIEAGQTFGTVNITGVNDTIYEGQENIIVDIDSVTNGKESGTQRITYSITDDDPKPLITLQVDKTELNENSENCIVTVTKQGDTTKDIIVGLGVTGTVSTLDYALGSTQITIPANETEKTTTLSILQDAIDEYNESIIIDIISVTNATEDGTQQKTVTIIDDDDEPTVSLSLENSPLAEDGGQATIKAILSEKSGKEITVNLGYGGTASANEYTANTAITINAGQAEGSLIITGIDDKIDEDTETIDIEITSAINGTENGVQILSAEISDDDTANLVITESDGSSFVNESGSTTDKFTVELSTKPVSNVVLNVASSDIGEVVVDKSILTYTEDNWNVAQTVTLTAIDDYIIDGDKTILINITVDDGQSDNKYDGLSSSIDTDIIDNDIAGFTITETDGNTLVSEDATTDIFTVQLDAKPQTNVVINLTNSDTTEKTISHANLTFTKDNWNIAQTVTITGVNDDVKDGDEATSITLSIDQLNTDDIFDLVASQTISVTTIDNDIPNLVITQDNGISVTEGLVDTDQIKIRLSTQPVGGNDVNIALTPRDTSEISLSKTTITILNADWNKDHKVTIASVDDMELDGDITSSIDIATTSSDSDYNGLSKTVQVITLDDEEVNMSILANNNIITNGDAIPTTSNNTDFGSADIHAQTVMKTYRIENTGNYNLRLTNNPIVMITGDTDFTIVNQPANIIAGGANTTFTIKFDPNTIGEKTATVCIANNDMDNNPYTFVIKGNGTKDIDAPTITKLNPSNGEGNIAIGSNLEITFNENIIKGIGNIRIYKDSDDSLVENISSNNIAINEKVITINPTHNLVHGVKYYVKIDNNTFTDEVGNAYAGMSNKTTWSFTTKSQSSSSSNGGYSSSSNNNNNNNTSKEVGKKEGSLGKIETKYKNGRKIITVIVDKEKLEEELRKEALGAKVTITVNTQEGSLAGQLNGQMVKNMEEKEAIVEIKTEKATYTLPANQINIDKISNELGGDIALEDIDVEVKIGEISKEMVKIVEKTAKKEKFDLVVAPVDFEVTCSYKGKKVNVSKFNAYVERTIALPKDVDPFKITTGIIIYPDGTTCHVPTQIIKVDGEYYVKINSLTNSTYTVVWNPRAYSDLENHCCKDNCNEMSARMIVEGESETTFNPDQELTRLFFTETVVKALGLGDKGRECSFTDIYKEDEFFGYIATSAEYELIKGYPDNTFRPDYSITREEAATLVLRAMKLAGMKVEYTDEELQNEIDKFVDKADIHDWAKKPIAICAINGLIVRNDQNQFLPKANITRAELAVIMKKMLEKADLI